MIQRIVCPVQQPDTFDIEACDTCRYFEASKGEHINVHCKKNRSPQHRRAFETAVLANKIGRPETVIVEGTEEQKQED